MLNTANYANIDPWAGMAFVVWLIAPLATFAIIVALALYLAFVVLPRRLPKWAVSVPDPDAMPTMSASYLLLTSMFGVALGALVKLLGGFDKLVGDAGTADVGGLIVGVASVLLLALGTLGTLLNQEGKLTLQRPLGAIAFLSCFLASGFYFQYLVLTIG